MKGYNKSVQLMEMQVIELLGDLFQAEDAHGYVTSGGTEANIVAFWAAKNLGEGKNEVLAASHSHYSIEKISRLLGLNVVEIPLKTDYQLDLGELERRISDKTLGIFATAGTSELGVIDPIKELSDIALKNNLYLHVDAAYGGFVIPFMREIGYDTPNFDFSISGVSSITVDPHKMGMIPLPAGAILFSDKKFLDAISFEVKFPPMVNYTLLGSRPGAPVAATWALLKHLGREGYKRVIKKAIDNTVYLTGELRRIEGVTLVMEPQINIVGFTYKKNPEETKGLLNFLNDRGYQIIENARPYSIRLVIGAHVERAHIEKLINTIKGYMHPE